MQGFAAVRVEPVGMGSSQALEAVIELGDLFRDRLGQLPYAVFTEAVEQSRLLVAVPTDGGLPLGYALFRLPRNEVSLTHLCVREDAREHGVARALVDAISGLYRDRLGVRAKCRDDYELARAWTKLGFQPRARTTGRGRDRAPMTVWWKDHGHPDLFTEFEQPVEVRAAVDLNILRDLAAPEKRKQRSQFLIADHLAGRLELVVTSGMHAEIQRATPQRQQPLLEAFAGYHEVSADQVKAEELEERILDVVKTRSPRYPSSVQDRHDLVQVAHAAAAGLGVFLTWDDGLINTLGAAVEELTGMKIMAPEYVIRHLDELANAESFLKQNLADSDFSTTRAGATVEPQLYAFVATFAGERRNHLRDHVRKLVGAGHDLHLIHAPEPDGTLVALYTVVDEDQVLQVPLLRLADHRLTDTLARYLLWSFRRVARSKGAALLKITEPHLSPRLVQAADFDRMIHVDGHWYTPVVDVCGSSAEVAAAAKNSYELAGFGAPPLLTPGMSPHAATTLEHAWWPAKIMDSDLPCYAISVQASFAYELFGYQSGMTPRATQLSLGREHVYYHSAVKSVLTAPARILWYASGDGPGAAHFFAASRLDGLMVDTPEQLHATLGYYGVFGLPAVVKAARGRDRAEALRLSNTELFDKPVSLRTYQDPVVKDRWRGEDLILSTQTQLRTLRCRLRRRTRSSAED